MQFISGIYNYAFGNQIASNRPQETPSLTIKIFGVVASILLITGGALAAAPIIPRRRIDEGAITAVDSGAVATALYGVCPSRLENRPERFCDKVVETMSLLNQSPHVLHVNDLQKGPRAEERFLNFRKKIGNLGFREIVVNFESALVYTGKNPAAALDALLDIKPLIIECGQALRLSQYRALKDLVGPQKFNRIIERLSNGKLAIASSGGMPIYDQTLYYQNLRHPTTQKEALKDVAVGDMLYIAGPSTAFSYKPSSDLNGFNLVCSRIDSSGVPYFKGFQSYSDKDFRFEELEALFLESHNRPFTHFDLKFIAKNGITNPHATVPFATSTNRELLDELIRLCGEPFMKAVAKAQTVPEEDILQDSGIELPEQLKAKAIMGILTIDRVNADLLERLHEEDRPIVQEHIRLEQGSVASATKTLYDDCLQAKKRPFFGGLYLFGETTHSAKAIIEKLTREPGYTVWSMSSKTTNHPSRLLSIWKRCDLLFLDGIDAENKPVAEAALTFARKFKKMVLATGKSSPFTLFSSNTLAREGDLIQVVEVRA